MRRFLGALILIAAVARGAAAQARDPSIGARVRFRAVGDPSGPRLLIWTEGHVARTGPDTIVVRLCKDCRDSLRTLTPLEQFEIERRRGVGSRGKNAAVGAVTGAVAGVSYVAYDISACNRRPVHELCGLEILITPVAVGGGAAVGALVGMLVASWWEPLLLFPSPRGN